MTESPKAAPRLFVSVADRTYFVDDPSYPDVESLTQAVSDTAKNGGVLTIRLEADVQQTLFLAAHRAPDVVVGIAANEGARPGVN